MIKSLLMFTNLLLSEIDIFSPKRHSDPIRLEKQNEKTTFENLCEKACPYVLLIALALFTILILIILVKYGHAFSTEANNYYYNMG